MCGDSTEEGDQTESSTEEEDQSPGLQLLLERRSVTMSKPSEGIYLYRIPSRYSAPLIIAPHFLAPRNIMAHSNSTLFSLKIT